MNQATYITEPKRVSILIVNFNGALFLNDCLNSLRKITWPNYEIIVVDNASTDDSLKIIQQFPEVKLIQNNKNAGFAGGNNLGLRHCNGDFILLLNSDTRVTPGFLEPLCEYFQNHKYVGIIQAKMTLPRQHGRLDACGSFITPFGFLYHYGILKPDGPQYNKDYPVFSAKGACLMFRKELINYVGGFLFKDEYFCYYEETDFCIRAWIAGWETHFVHKSRIEHLQAATTEKTHGQEFMLAHYLSNQTLSLLSNLQWRSIFIIFPFYSLIFISGLLVSLLTMKYSLFKSFVSAVIRFIKNMNSIKRSRKIMKQIRKVNDRQIFTKTMKWPGLNYFLLSFKGDLDKYIDRF